MLSPWNKSYDKPRQCVKKQRHRFADKGMPNQSYGFSSSHVQMWELDHKEGWVLKNWCYQVVCWSRLLRNPWTARRPNQSILKEISTLNIHWKDWCWSRSSNSLVLCNKEPTYWKRSWCCEGSSTGGEGDDRGRDGWMASLTQWTWVSKLWETIEDREA